MKCIIIITVLVVVAQTHPNGLSINKEHNEEWEMYKTKHGKTYENMEEYSRRLIWEENIKYIQEHNIRYDLGEHSYFLGINQFTDMTHEEFKSKYLGFGRPKKQNNTVKYMAPLNMGALPTTVNWVTKGYVTGVKNQGQCGSCWSFSTTGSLEGQYFRKKNNLISFSEQQLVDCSRAFGNNGCNGGLMDDAFQYIQKYGIEREQDYRYTAQDGQCKYNSAKVVTKVSGYVNVQQGNENDLASAVATQGPISVAIDASNPSFQSYSGGVYNEVQCSSTALDHGVLAVGYGVEVGKKYWLVKNSWGSTWGLKGYIKMSKDKNNQCGIATMASYPTL